MYTEHCTCIQAFWIKCAARKLIPLLARCSLPLYDTNAGFVCLTALGTSNGGLEGDFWRATLSDLAEAAIWISEHHALFRSYQIKQNQRCYTARLKYCNYLLRADIFVYITVVFAIIIISLQIFSNQIPTAFRKIFLIWLIKQNMYRSYLLIKTQMSSFQLIK